MSQSKNYQLLIEKLDGFIRKYYLNKAIRGVLFSVGILLGLFLLVTYLESEFFFGKDTRKFLFYSFLVVSVAIISWLVATPLLRYFHLGKVISHQMSATIIGDHFVNVKDKLLNILQLREQADTLAHRELTTASIEQKSDEIKLVPFKSAIDLSKNRKYFKYALPPLLLFLFILFAAPSLITDSTHRIINNDKTFEREAPFHFVLENDAPEIIQYEDYVMDVQIDGDVLPEKVFITLDDFKYQLDKVAPGRFSYTFRNVQKSTSFSLGSGVVTSDEFNLTVLEKPHILSFSLNLDYPSYTGQKDEKLENIGDVVVPEGTRAYWEISGGRTDVLSYVFSTSGKEESANRKSNNLFDFSKRLRRDDFYKIYLSNKHITKGDSIAYSINVIKDQYPIISVEDFQDSSVTEVYYFVGQVSDDYGIRSVSFNYNITNARGVKQPTQTELLPTTSGSSASFDHVFDITQLSLKPGENVSFFFETFDNDGVNGSKSARTGVMSFEKPTVDEFEEMENENEEEIKEDLKESLEELKRLQDEFRKLREKLLQQQELDWQDKKELEGLLEKQKKLQEKIKKAKEKFDKNLKNQEEFNEPQEEIQKKQEQLQKLFEESLDPETEDLIEKIQELMEELNKEDALEMMEDMELSEEAMEKNTERLLELFKQLEMEMEITEQIEKLEELAEKQEELSEETKEESKPSEELKKEQEEINEEFEEVKEKMEELEEKNKELSPPKDMGDDNEERMEDIQQDLNKSGEKMEGGEMQQASESQKDAAKKMKDMAGNLQQQMAAGEMEQMEEDIKALRQLLENLIDLSFDQEDLVNDLGRTQLNTPRYVDLVQHQFKLKDDFRLIEDSLTALSTRVTQIESFVTEKVFEVKENMKEGIEFLEDRKKPQATDKQRRTMKNVNDLALMLSESMQQMQQQMGAMMPGSQQCNKPGNNPGQKPGKGKAGMPMDKITKGQGQLNEQLQKMIEDAKGKKEGKGKGGSAKEFAEAAAKQAALRKALEEMKKNSQEQGKGDGGLQDIIDQMDKIETYLVNKRLNAEMLKRQKDIMTRLLKAEKADRQREFENKRKAERTSNKKREIPPSLEEYIKKRKAETEFYKTISPDLKPYYKALVDKYYKELKGSK